MVMSASNSSEQLLDVRGLQTHFYTEDGVVKAVDGVDLNVRRGEIFGLVGESGCGKSVTALSILQLIDKPGKIVGGEVHFGGTALHELAEKEMVNLRGKRISMIFQQPLSSLNPVFTGGAQVAEVLKIHWEMEKEEAWNRAIELYKTVGIADAEEKVNAYPHELSGGQAQRVMIAMALATVPELLIADEPTTALDVTIQAQILHEVQKLCRERGTAMIWITHDLAVIAGLADRVSVMYAGRIVEAGALDDVLDRPVHPYTKGLIGSVPSRNKRGAPLYQIPGMPPALLSLPPGCAFRERCPRASSACREQPGLSEPVPGRAVRCFHPHPEQQA